MLTADNPGSGQPRPYASTAGLYWAAGWRGPLPLPVGRKWPPPEGWTGNHGAWPSYADLHAWTEGSEGTGNIGLRLPPHVIGLDVDAYADKAGGATLTTLEQKHGSLPATWRTTSRDDGTSGIRLYRVPPGLAWPSVAGPGIEVIRTGHRYAVAWPSIHPDTGGTYRWITPDGLTAAGVVPSVDELPDLPDTWIQGLTCGQKAQDIKRAGLGSPEVLPWLASRDGTGVPCRAVRLALTRAQADLSGGLTARHDAALAATARLAHLAADGHHGVLAALVDLRASFNRATAGERRDPGEWDRMLDGAVDIAAADPPALGGDPCEDPFHGLLPPGDRNTPPDLPPAPSANPEDGEGEQRDRTSWWPRDLGPTLAGKNPEQPPTTLTRDDDHALFYAGKVNGIIGASESGKTWIALTGVAQTLASGGRVYYLDFEDTPAGIVDRLRGLGVPDNDFERFDYADPDEGMHELARTDVAERITLGHDLVVLDGVNAAMTLLGLDLMSNTDCTRFAQLVLKPLTAGGATVLYIDHIPKSTTDDTAGGIGAQAKRAMTTGCAIKVKVLVAFGKGITGKLSLTVDKDRPGFVRGASAGAKNAGTFILSPDPDGAGLKAWIEAPDTRPREKQGPFRPTHLMERVSVWLQTIPDGATRRAVLSEVTGKREAVAQALDILVAEGYASRSEENGRGGARLVFRHLKPFEEASEGLVAPEVFPRSPSVPQRSPDGGQGTLRKCSPSPLPPTGRGNTSGSLAGPENTPTVPLQTRDGYLVDSDTGEVLQ